MKRPAEDPAGLLFSCTVGLVTAARAPAGAGAGALPLLEARRAVDWLVATRLERDAGLSAAARAGDREHLAARTRRAAVTGARAAVAARAVRTTRIAAVSRRLPG